MCSFMRKETVCKVDKEMAVSQFEKKPKAFRERVD